MELLCKQLSVNNNKFDAVSFFDSIVEYINNYDRILYSVISNVIYDYYDKKETDNDNLIGTMNSNLDAVLKYVQSTDYENKVNSSIKKEKDKLLYARKTVFKIWDHINLAQQQYSVLKQSDDDYKEKFKKSIAPVREKLTKEMSAQLITMVGIFTAVAFLVFGSISSLDNVFSNTNIPLLKAVIIGSVWGLCVVNLIFVFLFCVAKMTRLNFKSSNKKDATIFQKYPIVWWSNLTILSIIFLCFWCYYLTKENIYFWFVEICIVHPKIATVSGFILIILIISIMFKKLIKATKHISDDEE